MTLSKVNQTEKDKYCFHFYVESKKIKQMNKCNEQKKTDRENRQMVAREDRDGKGKIGEVD